MGSVKVQDSESGLELMQEECSSRRSKPFKMSRCQHNLSERIGLLPLLEISAGDSPLLVGLGKNILTHSSQSISTRVHAKPSAMSVVDPRQTLGDGRTGP